MDVLFWVITGSLSLVIIVMGWVIRNLIRKHEAAEDIVVSYIQYLDKFSRIIEVSSKKMEEIDHRGTFESDDEVGFFFKQIKEIQGMFNEFNLHKEED